MNRLIVICFLAAAACSEPLRVEVAQWKEPNVPRPAWLDAPDLYERTRAAALIAVRVWGGSEDDLANVTIRYVPEITDCDEPAIGCTTTTADVWRTSNVVSILWWGVPCLEASPLAHEMGHVVLGAGEGHEDARWCNASFWKGMASAMLSTPYTNVEPPDVSCWSVTTVFVGSDPVSMPYCM